MPIRKPGEKRSAFDQSVEDVNPHLRVPDLDAVEGEPLVAKPIPLDSIHADPRQPRRAVPPALRGGWDGSPVGVVDLLTNWRKATAERLGQPIDVHKLILKRDERVLENVAKDDPIADGFLDLVSLAASIHHDGLINPPTVARDGDRYRVTGGERRTLAYHLLLAVTGDERYTSIPAFKDDRRDVWKQAAENTNRDQLNAIGMARQIALLLIDLYESEGHEFGDYHALHVPVGTDGAYSDRPYYAQVADGHQFRIPYGEGQRVQDAMGLSSRRMLSAYRNLLTVPDRLWLLADNYDFTEGRMRDAVKYMTDDEWRYLDDLADDDQRVQYIIEAIKDGKRVEELAKQEDELLPTGNNVTDPTPSPQGDLGTLEEWDAAIYDPTPGDDPAPDDIPPPPDRPPHTKLGWAAGDRCTVQGRGPGTVERVDSERTVTVVLARTGERLTAISERYLVDPAPAPGKDVSKPSGSSSSPGPTRDELRKQITDGTVIVMPNGQRARITKRLFNGSTFNATYPDGRETMIAIQDVTAIAADQSWPEPPQDPASLPDDEFEQPQRTTREKRIVNLTESDAALLNRLMLYAEEDVPSAHHMMAIIFDGQDVLPGTPGDALDILTDLQQAIDADLRRLNTLINLAHGYEEPDA